MHNAASLIPQENLGMVLPFALPWLEKTLQRYSWNRFTLDEIVQGLHIGRFQLWVGSEDNHYLYVVTEVVQETPGATVHVLLGGGSLDDDNSILRHIELIEQWARDIGAKGTVVWGRLGWGRKLAPYGYHLETSLFRRTFTDRMH